MCNTKIPHTGDTESLDLCGYEQLYQKGQTQIKSCKKNVLCHMWCVTCHVSDFKCHLSPVTCHLSPVTCHLSLTPTATATDPLRANSSNMHSRVVSKDPNAWKFLNANNHRNGKKVMRKSWKSHEKVRTKSWESHEKVMRRSWESHEKVYSYCRLCRHACLVCSVRWSVSYVLNGGPQDHGLPFRQRPW